MSSRYKQYHLDQLATSSVVNLPIGLDGINISNPKGRYWAEIISNIMGSHDIRPRLGTFTNPWSAISNPLFSAPSLTYISDDLGTLLDRRSHELLTQTLPIAVMWSGGIDSTCVLTSLIKNSKDTSQLIVYCNHKSINENPEFYKQFIDGKIECRDSTTLKVTGDFIDSHALLTGDPGDCLFGPSMAMYAELLPDNKHTLAWRDNRNLIARGIVSIGASTGFAEWYTDKVSDNIEEVGVENINSISDWWWWHYFNLKWEFSLLRPFFQCRLNDRSTISQETLKKYIDNSFYNTDYFQNWSYSNLNNLCRDPSKHKIDAKKYIFELDHNQNYFENKHKMESVFDDTNKRPVYMDKDFRQYYMNDPGLREALTELLEQYRG